APWARWCSKEGNVLKTGAERTFELSAQNSELSNQNSELAEQLAKEQQEKAKEQERVEKLMAQLAALGLKPDA
ncbi:MAG: hypothetical protein MUE85_08170, partial [Microscillaceae bacterium]|nr:hypothetical protein [Microscillaceae bacterium]